MAKYEKVNGHWEIIPSSREKDEINKNEESVALSSIAGKLSLDKLQPFIKQDSPADFMLKLYVPRYYNDGSRVSPDVIADILAKISEAVGGASTWAGKGYWTESNILYEDKNIYVEVLLKNMSPDRASLLAKYLGSVIAGTLKQEGALTVLLPVMAEFLSSSEYIDNIKNTLEDINHLNEESSQYSQENTEI